MKKSIKHKPVGFWKHHSHDKCGICSKPRKYRKALLDKIVKRESEESVA